MNTVIFEAINEMAKLPYKGTKESACYDLISIDDTIIGSGETKVIHTGLKVQHIDPGYKIHVYSRSGLAAKKGVCVLNAPGVIDSDYRGELMVILHNTSAIDFIITAGDKIAQMAIEVSIPFSISMKLCGTSDTYISTSDIENAVVRGEGGLGSTGVSTNR